MAVNAHVMESQFFRSPDNEGRNYTLFFGQKGITLEIRNAIIRRPSVNNIGVGDMSMVNPGSKGVINGFYGVPQSTHGVKKILPSNKIHPQHKPEFIQKLEITQIIGDAIFQFLVPAHLKTKDYSSMKLKDRQLLDILESGFYVKCDMNNDGEIASVKLYCSQDIEYKMANVDLYSFIASIIDEINEANKKKSQDNPQEDKINHIKMADKVICEVVLDLDLETQSQFLKKKQKKEMDQLRKNKKKGRDGIGEKNQPIVVKSLEDEIDLNYVPSIAFILNNYFIDGMGIDFYRNALGIVLGDNSEGSNGLLMLDSILYNPETTLKNIVVQENEGDSKIVVKFISKDGVQSTTEFSKSDIEVDGGDRNGLLNEIAAYEAALNEDEIDM